MSDIRFLSDPLNTSLNAPSPSLSANSKSQMSRRISSRFVGLAVAMGLSLELLVLSTFSSLGAAMFVLNFAISILEDCMAVK